MLVTFYRDRDSDGIGAMSSGSLTTCSAPAGYVTEDGDCDDFDITRFPGAPEICDTDDEDCDATVDEVGEKEPGQPAVGVRAQRQREPRRSGALQAALKIFEGDGPTVECFDLEGLVHAGQRWRSGFELETWRRSYLVEASDLDCVEHEAVTVGDSE